MTRSVKDRSVDPLARERPGIAWLAPAAVLFGGFGLLPIVGVVYLSCTSWNGLGDPVWAGMKNWLALIDDPEVYNGLTKTVVVMVASWLVQTPIAMLIGVWTAGARRSRSVLSVFFALPLLLSTVAITLTWLALLDPNFGLAPVIGKYMGVPDGNFLGDSTRALGCVVVVIAWQYIPFHALIYQAGARQIPQSIYEAAKMDGVGAAKMFSAITLPLLKNTIVASSVTILIGSLAQFESILLLTGGGPGTATRTVPLHMYIKGFVAYDMGYASAVAVLLVAIGTGLAVAIVRTTGYHRMSSQSEGL